MKGVHDRSFTPQPRVSRETTEHKNQYDDKYVEARMLRMYKYPASIKEAQMHNKANEFGYNSRLLSDGKAAPICPCCEFSINTLPIPLDYPTTPSQQDVKFKDLQYMLNEGTVMFFTFIKMAIVYLLLRFFISDCYNLATNIISTNCDQPHNIELCRNNLVARLSSYNKNTPDAEPYLYIVDMLNLVAVVFSIIFLFYYSTKHYEIYERVNGSNITQSDYTIFVENIPYFLPYDPNAETYLECWYEKSLKDALEVKLKAWVQQVFKTKGTRNELERIFYQMIKDKPNFQKEPIVRSVSLCYDLTEMQKLMQIRATMMKEHNSNVSKGVNKKKNLNFSLPFQIETLNHEYIQLSKKFSHDDSMAFSLSHFVGKAFVSFQYQHYKIYLLEYFKDELEIAQSVLKVSSPAEPSDAYWFNMKVTESERTKSIFVSYLIMLMTLLFSFVLIFILQYYQFSNTEPANPNQSTSEVINSYIFTFSITILTTAINFGLAAFCQKLSEWEGHETTTNYISSLMVKSIISQFLNTALIYYIIAVVSEITIPEKSSPLSENGLVMQVTSLVAVSGGLQVFMNLLQVGSLYNKVCNCFKYKGETVDMFQVELNEAMQDPEFNFAERYAYYIVNVGVISFFGYITPYISLILAVIFAIQYWIDKINLFKRFTCATDFDFRLSRMTLKIFQVSIVVFSVGNLIFSSTLHPTKRETQYHTINLVSLFLALLYCICSNFLPKSWFERIDVKNYEQDSYSDCLKEKWFNQTYWLSNPATSFAKEIDINKYDEHEHEHEHEHVDYGQRIRFASTIDYDEFILGQKKLIADIEFRRTQQIADR